MSGKGVGFGVPVLTPEWKLYKENLHHEHYIRKHVLGAEKCLDNSPCSMFSLTIPEVTGLVKSTIEEGKYRLNSTTDKKVIFEKRFDKPIGTDINNEPAYCCRVITRYWGFSFPEKIQYNNFIPVITAYPVSDITL